jgi:hypothetical protein
MKNIHERLADLGLKIPEILLPWEGIDIQKWAVIACDQFTQDQNYWEKVKNEAGDAPTTLNLILPEVYLEDGGITAKTIHSYMKSYLEGGVFAPPRHCGVYLERSTPFNKKRRGLILAIDLEQYDWAPEARPLIRATEGTVQERLPPRVQIRRNAPLETSHILLLIDDEEDTLIPGLAKEALKAAPLYTSPLMMNSGSVTGWTLDTDEAWTLLAEGLENLAQKAASRYGVTEKTPFLYAAGDGNHSLAAAKAVWEEYKAAHPDESIHPSRFALVELENLHDPGISFQPIHRLIFGVEPETILKALPKSPEFALEMLNQEGKPVNIFCINSDSADIATVHLEPLLEAFVRQQGPGVSIDYIHGEEELIRLVSNSNRQVTGLFFPSISKNGFFRTIAQNGPLPRKSFSMGEGCEKRFYLECRKLFG